MSEYIIECEYDSDEGWIPGEHREEIVRCRDCKHLNKLSRKYEDYECCLTYMDVTLNGFCSWAERREP